MRIKQELPTLLISDMSVPTLTLDPSDIHAIMINEVVPMDPKQDFYGKIGDEYLYHDRQKYPHREIKSSNGIRRYRKNARYYLIT